MLVLLPKMGMDLAETDVKTDVTFECFFRGDVDTLALARLAVVVVS